MLIADQYCRFDSKRISIFPIPTTGNYDLLGCRALSFLPMPTIHSFFSARSFFVLLAAFYSCRLMAAEWTYDWSLDRVPTAEICPLLYGKTWAYSVQIDDSPVTTRSVALDFFANYQYSDAPPGVDNGNLRPFVGDAAVFLYVLGANDSYLQPEQLREMTDAGWGIANHSYFHRGRTWGNPPEILSEEELRADLFWSQSIIAHDFGDGRAPSHFVYPNGYQDYKTVFDEFGIISGSSYAAKGGVRLLDPNTEIKLLSRAYLDEGRWKSAGQGDPLFMFPMGGEVVPGLLQIDFTHGIDKNPYSENRERWKDRMDHIASDYGAQGDDSVWSAPTEAVIHYVEAAKEAKVEISENHLRVILPDSAPGSPLTVRLEGIPESTVLPQPEGGLLYRDGSTVWITTPMLGLPGADMPEPAIVSIYEGPVGKKEFEEPVDLAGVQVFHRGSASDPIEVKVLLTLEDGSLHEMEPQIIHKSWSNGYLLFNLLPESESLRVVAIDVPQKPILKTMRVWAVE